MPKLTGEQLDKIVELIRDANTPETEDHKRKQIKRLISKCTPRQVERLNILYPNGIPAEDLDYVFYLLK